MLTRSRIDSRCRLPARARCGGFTLVEILVAVLVMAIGLLGIAALQTTALQFTRGAYYRSQATSLAYDIADRMRANREAALGGDYDVAFADPAPTCGAPAGETVAELDISAWRSEIACLLPAGNGRIEVEDGVATIGIRWNETDEDEAELFQMTTAL